MNIDDIDDEEIEAIQEQAREDALHCVHMASTENPYATDERRREIYNCAFRNAYAIENGY